MRSRLLRRSPSAASARWLGTIAPWCVGFALLWPVGVAAQGIAVAPKVGTTGIGADLILSLAPKLALKGGVGFTLIDTRRAR